jgi:hypothetical protein
VSSEDPAHPVEAALIDTAAGAAGDGWRASVPGEQFLRLRFDTPRRLTRISILFVEHAAARTQEFAITWSADGREYREIVRQQWNFNPAGSTRELEDYRVPTSEIARPSHRSRGCAWLDGARGGTRSAFRQSCSPRRCSRHRRRI